ncbi:hypothetical protein TH53_01945 [Pedobacter lusitanus]|uniref:Uncharacterized protein n=1 Tax=Pedobacter lusitanus TaxID=1503925 RepID=A0A0D0GR52_9SPHI|nr:hypothetical protein [Pedobacter lusitanus]KIO78680.1 hypothetical protein TH53_01945 [Pedobacter lusitanus]
MKNGSVLTCEKEDYHGFFTRPFNWEDTIIKFLRLSSGVIGREVQEEIINHVKVLEELEDMKHFAEILSKKIR